MILGQCAQQIVTELMHRQAGCTQWTNFGNRDVTGRVDSSCKWEEGPSLIQLVDLDLQRVTRHDSVGQIAGHQVLRCHPCRLAPEISVPRLDGIDPSQNWHGRGRGRKTTCSRRIEPGIDLTAARQHEDCKKPHQGQTPGKGHDQSPALTGTQHLPTPPGPQLTLKHPFLNPVLHGRRAGRCQI